MKWGIYHAEREYARINNDECLGVVEAETKDQAEQIAAQQGIFSMAGLWAYPLLNVVVHNEHNK